MFRKSILALFAALSVTAAFPAVTNRVGALAPSAVVTTGEGYTNLSERITAASAGAAAALEVHDTNTVRHVTAKERSTWNAKQAALTPGVHYATPAQVSNAAVVAYSDTAAAVARIAVLEAGTNTWHAKQNALVAGTDYAQPGSWSNDISYVESLTVTNSDRLAGIEAMTNSWSSKQGALTAGTDYATPTQLDTAKIDLGAVDTALSNRIVTLEGNVSTWNAKQNALVAGTDYATPAQVSGDITTVNASIDGVASRVTVLEGNVATWNAKQNALTAGTDYATPGSVTSVSNRMEETDASLAGRLALVEAGTNTWNAKQAALTAETDYATPTQLVTEAGTRLAADNALSGRLALIESNTNLWTGKQGALVAGTDYITPDDANVVIVPLVNARLGEFATTNSLYDVQTNLEARLADAQPADYANVSNLAVNAVTQEQLAGVQPSDYANVSNLAVSAASADSVSGVTDTSWMRPDDWRVIASVRTSPTSVVDVNVVTNNSSVYSNQLVTLSYSLTADLRTEMLDEFPSVSAVPTPVWSAVNGGTITGNTFTASAPGTWRVGGTVGSTVRYCDIPLTTRVGSQSSRVYYVYDVADDTNSWKKAVNDAAYATLMASTWSGVTNYVRTGTDGWGNNPDYPYKVWYTQRCPCRAVSGSALVGFRNRSALTPHVLIAAAHYGDNWNSGSGRWISPDGTQTNDVSYRGLRASDMNVPSGHGVRLYNWALTNGWTEAELAPLGISDIAVYPVASGTIPEACCPYVMSVSAWKKHFGGGKVMGWTSSRAMPSNYMLPAVIDLSTLTDESPVRCASGWATASDIGRWLSSGTSSQYCYVPKAFEEAFATRDWMFPPIYSGDSGGGIYIKYQDKWIVCSEFHFAGGGPSVSAALPILRAYCAQYGDVLKEINE